MTFKKHTYYFGYLLLFVNAFNSFATAATSLHSEIENQILNDLFNIHPTASINIAFNLPKTQKKYANCKNFYLPTVKNIPPGGRISLRLTCKQPNWSTYISIKSSISYPVATAIMHINKGQKMTSDNIAFRLRDISKVNRGYFINPQHLLGKQAKRVIKSSTIISPYMLDEPLLIRRGDSVIIQAGGTGLKISTLGTALQDGKQGRQIRVKNDRSGKIIKAYVLSVGKVTIHPQ
ncbi:MAG: flagellar basal body P-ring formation protein FlgA [Pseudomonadales bacterium]|nr:flagellar basal body P-ring formation protein FlgA [Pseudomonadales bacterium]